MKYWIGRKYILFLIFFTIIIMPQAHSAVPDKLQIYSPNYFNEQNNIYENINYLKNEPLSFKFCTDPLVENISFQIFCQDNQEITPLTIYEFVDKTKGCYFSNYELESLDCNTFKLEINSKLDGKLRKIERNFKEQKPSLLTNHILEIDYNTLNSRDLSYYLIVLNDVQDKNNNENSIIYEKLKNDRNNVNKCWPKETCNFDYTTIILRNLYLSQYKLDTRMLEDGKTYLEKYIINNNNNPLSFKIKFDYIFSVGEEISCKLKIDDDLNEERTYLFNKQSRDSDNLYIEKEASKKIDFLCNQTLDNINLSIYNIDATLLKSKTYDDVSSFIYTIDPFSCVGSTKCNYYNSIDSLIVYNNQLKDKVLIENYIENLKIEENNEKYLYFSDKILDTSKYIFYKNDPILVNYLKFRQNNDGSWGDGTIQNKILKTSWSILGLEKSIPKSEYVEDAKKWVYYNEPIEGWGDIEKNSFAYLAIKEKLKPYIKINVKNELTKTTYFEIENPTIYDLKNLKVTLSPEINQYLSYTENIGNLNGQEKIKFNITLNEKFFGLKSGNLKITGLDGKNKEIILLDIPINIVGNGFLKVKEDSYTISPENPNIQINFKTELEKYDLKCSYLNPLNQEKKNTQITNTQSYIILENPNEKDGNYTLDLKCTVNNAEFEMPLKFNIKKSKKTIEVNLTTLIITGFDDFYLPIKNIDTQKQTIQISIEGPFDGVIVPTELTKILAKNETRELYFSIQNPTYVEALGNTTKNNIVITAQNGYILKIPISYSPLPIEEEKSNLILYLIISLIVLLGLGALVLKRYKELQKEHNFENHRQEDGEFFIDDDLQFE